MTEITDKPKPLASAAQRFVLHWGEMGTSWGVNRSVGQIHGLLYLSEKPLTAEEIAVQLDMARSNVSNSLKELVGWQLIKRVHIMGDRRDHFEADTDLWEILLKIVAGRKTREIDPTRAMLEACAADAGLDKTMSKAARKRIADMLAFVTMLDRWHGQMSRLPAWKLKALVKMGAAVQRFIGGGKGSQ